MASQWFCRLFDEEMGPLAFHDLEEMVRAGTLTENDPVRRQGTEQWIRAGDVLGLFRPAGAKPSAPVPSAPPAGPAQAEPSLPDEPKRRRLGKRARIGLVATLAAFCVVLLGWAIWASRPARFPQPVRSKPKAQEAMLSNVRPTPKESSVPDLKQRVPQLVPGLEEVHPAYSPSLTADLRTIVFSAPGHPKTKYDLYLATREDATQPFGSPQLIESCVSPEIDARPTLSPDGRELIFQRSDAKPQFFYCRRDSQSSDFGEPVLWPMPKFDPTTHRLERAQFVGSRRVVFVVKELSSGKCSLLVADRDKPEGKFGPLREESTWNIVAGSFLTEDGLRSYVGWREAFALVARGNASEPFGLKIELATAAVTGPFDGPSWVSPQEDVVFYCSPGPGREPGSDRRLWMFRF